MSLIYYRLTPIGLLYDHKIDSNYNYWYNNNYNSNYYYSTTIQSKQSQSQNLIHWSMAEGLLFGSNSSITVEDSGEGTTDYIFE